jgi:predicted ester cyclase
MEKILIDKYFKAWNNKEIIQLKNMVSEDIYIKDWDNEAFGVTEFLNLNKKIFRDFDTIQANVLSIISDDEKVFARLKIQLNSEFIEVVDYFEIKFNQIIKIQAYRCF